jgi:hypothetical protein
VFAVIQDDDDCGIEVDEDRSVRTSPLVVLLCGANPTTTPATASTTSMKNRPAVVVIQKDGQPLGEER